MDHLELQWQDSSQFEGRFRIFPEIGTFSVSFPISVAGKSVQIKTKIQIKHFPVVFNHATTRHKLQGKSLDALVIAQWSKAKKWAYVVISRVRTLAGLFLTHPIPDDIDFMPSGDYLEMMKNLRNTILTTPDQVETLKSDFKPDSLF